MIHVHEQRRPYLCQQCGFSCQTNNALKRHVDRVHEKKRPFKCLMCDFSFAGQSLGYEIKNLKCLKNETFKQLMETITYLKILYNHWTC